MKDRKENKKILQVKKADKSAEIQDLAIIASIEEFKIAISNLMLQTEKNRGKSSKDQYNLTAIYDALLKLTEEIAKKIPQRLLLDQHGKNFIDECQKSPLWQLDNAHRQKEILIDTATSVALAVLLTITLTLFIMSIQPQIPLFVALIKLIGAIVISAVMASASSYVMRPLINAKLYNTPYMATSANVIVNNHFAFFERNAALRNEEENKIEISEIGTKNTKHLMIETNPEIKEFDPIKH